MFVNFAAFRRDKGTLANQARNERRNEGRCHKPRRRHSVQLVKFIWHRISKLNRREQAISYFPFAFSPSTLADAVFLSPMRENVIGSRPACAHNSCSQQVHEKSR